MTARIKNSFKNAEIGTVRELVGWSHRDLRELPNFGLRSLAIVERVLGGFGLYLHRVPTPVRVEAVSSEYVAGLLAGFV